MSDTTAAGSNGWHAPVRVLAKVTSAGLLALVGAITVGEGLPSPASLTRTEAAQFLLFGGVCAGMALGWKRERLGGAISLASLAGFYGVEIAVNGKLPGGWVFPVLALPGVLFLLAGRSGRRTAADERE